MELGLCQFRWQEQFHGIPWNLECANFDDTSSSMEFRGTGNAPISMTRANPWKSIELKVRQFRWHEQFHGIPWNLECANFADRSSSMEFHGTWNAPISMTRAVPWNSVELGIRQFRWYEHFHGVPWNSMEFHWIRSAPISMTRAAPWIPWNSMEFEMRQFRWHEQFHGIPWNLKCATFVDTSRAMEFRGIWSVPISLTRAVPWNSMEFGIGQFRWHEQFHGIPWNWEYANFADTSSSMEFHGIPWNLVSANFTDTSNSREFRMRSFRWHEQFHGVPWN